MVDPLSYFLFQPVLHDWCNNGHGLCISCLCCMVHIKEPLLLIEKSSSCSGGKVFPLSLYEWSFTICPTPYIHKQKNVSSASLNKTFASFHFHSIELRWGKQAGQGSALTLFCWRSVTILASGVPKRYLYTSDQ